MKSIRDEVWGEPLEDLIEECCRETGPWRISHREGDRYVLRLDDHRPLQHVQVRYSSRMQHIPFQSWLSVRFPLDRTPSGLYGRLLLRSFERIYASWVMNISGSCEAYLGVVARIPASALTPALFDRVGRELLDEVFSFHQELRDKFQGDMGQTVRTSDPMENDITFIDDAPQTPLPAHVRYPLPLR